MTEKRAKKKPSAKPAKQLRRERGIAAPGPMRVDDGSDEFLEKAAAWARFDAYVKLGQPELAEQTLVDAGIWAP